jgi:hypothetical protein
VTGSSRRTPSIDQVRLARLVNDCYDLRLTDSRYLGDGLRALVDEWQRGWSARVLDDAIALEVERHWQRLAVVGIERRGQRHAA